MGNKTQTSSRKLDHLLICRDHQVEVGNTGFSDVRLVHEALPECDLGAISMKTRFLGADLSAPLFIAAMTGGHPETEEVNRRLARAAERLGLGMGVGSQRAALEHPDLSASFSAVREEAPHAFLCANLGAVQLRDHGAEWAERAVEMIDADALCIHLNFLQEAIQPEGDRDARGCLAAIADLCSGFRTPVIVKETGAGISRETARLLRGAGADAIDIGGFGGTSWAAVEIQRAEDERQKALGERFLDWGIPTVVSLMEVAGDGPVIATGGVRSGIDTAKAIALGADLAGMALPLLPAAMESDKALERAVGAVLSELRSAMFLTGSASIDGLRKSRTYITGTTREMIQNK
ncbi:type 2 isopentenyl-diphosphate Delta-isomerase [Methanofollis fontis]|uniref:Isopentenyl-diphosphate delta-isomerase n=1 Tax=Methanofollis fontis TaxID=2052832 RepID=A0A483CQS6_9EURY|nr:type 2 isopentenyl-diphosphate Delta-isomerase [Methanofollis fontis]TAJ43375.1 type 2 isopentenyl-diphosphate Delta-isomerase [Methanofollis fontis]